MEGQQDPSLYLEKVCEITRMSSNSLRSGWDFARQRGGEEEDKRLSKGMQVVMSCAVYTFTA